MMRLAVLVLALCGMCVGPALAGPIHGSILLAEDDEGQEGAAPVDPPSNDDRVFPLDAMADMNASGDSKSFTFCPKVNVYRCYTFVDGDRPGRQVTAAQLRQAEASFAGRRDGEGDEGDVRLSSLLGFFRSTTVRYQFADFGSAATHHEGLVCMGVNGEEGKSSPTWRACAYVTEVRSLRTFD